MRNHKKIFLKKEMLNEGIEHLAEKIDFSSLRSNILSDVECSMYSRPQSAGDKTAFKAVLLSVFFILTIAFSVDLVYNASEEAGNEVITLTGNGNVSLLLDGLGEGKYIIIKSTEPDFSTSDFLQWREVEGTNWIDAEPVRSTKAVFYRIEKADGIDFRLNSKQLHLKLIKEVS